MSQEVRPVRGKLPHSIPWWADHGSYFFVTVCAASRGRNCFCDAEIGQRVLSTVAHYHEHLKWHCRLFLLMPDHVHGIVSFPRDPGMKRTVTAWKSYVAKTCGIAWQADFFDHRLRNRISLEEKLDYVMQNPVRAGLCDRPEEWPYVYRPTHAGQRC